MERYTRLKARRTILKSSVTRQLNSLGKYVNVDTLNKSIFEQKRSSLQSTLSSLRSNLDAISETLLNVPGDEHEKALQDLKKMSLNMKLGKPTSLIYNKFLTQEGQKQNLNLNLLKHLIPKQSLNLNQGIFVFPSGTVMLLISIR